MMAVTIYHNPQCSNSRQVLKIIQDRGIAPTIVEYLKTPLSKDQLKALIAKMGVPVKDVVRWKQKDEVAAAGINESSSDEALLDAMVSFPILMHRPIVVTDKGAKLCRPGMLFPASYSYSAATEARAPLGNSSQVRPSKSRPDFFLLVPPHCLKWNATLLRMHWSLIERIHLSSCA